MDRSESAGPRRDKHCAKLVYLEQTDESDDPMLV